MARSVPPGKGNPAGKKRTLRPRAPEELKRAFEKYVQATQGNFDHLDGQAREFARQFNLLAQDIEVLYESLGIDPEEEISFGDSVGVDGDPGIDGLDGEDGLPGLDGIQGKDGKDGIPGLDGPQGAPGRAGLDGMDGTPGTPGPPGIDGIDGSTGQRGPTGPTGTQGEPGMPGLDGAMGPVGQNWDEGFLWIEAHDTEMTGGTASPTGEGTHGTDAVAYIEFAAATDGYATFTVVVPEDFDDGGPDGNYFNYRLFFAGSTTNSGEIWWHEDWLDLINNDIGGAPTESEEYTHGPVGLTADIVNEFGASLPILGGSPNLAAGSIVRFTIGRVGSDVNDTYTGTVKLLGVEFNYPRIAVSGPQGTQGVQGVEGPQAPDGIDSATGAPVFKTLVYNSANTADDGDQPADYAAFNYQIQRVWGVSEIVRSNPITVDLEVNGVSVGWPVASPTVPAAGGVGTERAPTSARVAKGDKVVVVFSGTGGEEGRAQVKLRVVAT